MFDIYFCGSWEQALKEWNGEAAIVHNASGKKHHAVYQSLRRHLKVPYSETKVVSHKSIIYLNPPFDELRKRIPGILYFVGDWTDLVVEIEELNCQKCQVVNLTQFYKRNTSFVRALNRALDREANERYEAIANNKGECFLRRID